MQEFNENIKDFSSVVIHIYNYYRMGAENPTVDSAKLRQILTNFYDPNTIQFVDTFLLENDLIRVNPEGVTLSDTFPDSGVLFALCRDFFSHHKEYNFLPGISNFFPSYTIEQTLESSSLPAGLLATIPTRLKQPSINNYVTPAAPGFSFFTLRKKLTFVPEDCEKPGVKFDNLELGPINQGPQKFIDAIRRLYTFYQTTDSKLYTHGLIFEQANLKELTASKTMSGRRNIVYLLNKFLLKNDLITQDVSSWLKLKSIKTTKMTFPSDASLENSFHSFVEECSSKSRIKYSQRSNTSLRLLREEAAYISDSSLK